MGTAIAGVIFLLIMIYLSVTFVLIYHLIRFGIGTQPKRLVSIFMFGSACLFGAALALFFRIDLKSILDLYV